MSPSDWACEETGAKDNLWLNLSTGHIGSGRPIWDGEKNIGGNGSALRHFEATGACRRGRLACRSESCGGLTVSAICSQTQHAGSQSLSCSRVYVRTS